MKYMDKALGIRAKKNRCIKYIEKTYPDIKYKDCSTDTDVINKLKIDECTSS